MSPVRALKLIFVIGCQRSGTTLTGQILGAHPEAVLLDETDGINDWCAGVAQTGRWQTPGFPEVLSRAATKYRNPAARITTDANGNATLAPHITHVVFKAPNLTYAYEAISQAEPSASIVAPIRDPRAVVASMAAVANIPMVENQIRLLLAYGKVAAGFQNELELLQRAGVPMHIRRTIIWRIKSGLAEKFAQANLRTFQFRYEDLVSDKCRYVTEILQHVGLQPTPTVFSHNSEYVGFGPGNTDRQRQIDEISLNRWSLSFSQKEANEIMENAGELAAKWHYM
jgi:hypothetical protein